MAKRPTYAARVTDSRTPVQAGARVRRAEDADLARVAELAGRLIRMHHETDPARFFLPERVEEGYAWWLARELKRKEAVVLVAEADGSIVGYAYGSVEGRDWNMLLDVHGELRDVFVAPDARRSGVGRSLVSALVAELEGLGAPRVVLSTMVGNEAAQRLFRACGFRPTMLEMTRG
jgi:ribosomal protein S18 acetylase RimI-like enzyme